MRMSQGTIASASRGVSSAKRGRAGLYQKDRHLSREQRDDEDDGRGGFPCEAAIGCVIVVVRTTLLREARASSVRNNKAFYSALKIYN